VTVDDHNKRSLDLVILWTAIGGEKKLGRLKMQTTIMEECEFIKISGTSSSTFS